MKIKGKPYFMLKEEWFFFDEQNGMFRLTKKATKEAIDSYNAYIKIVNNDYKDEELKHLGNIIFKGSTNEKMLPSIICHKIDLDCINNVKNVYLNRTKRRKSETYIRSYLKKGDIYYSVYNDQLYLLKIVHIGETYSPKVSFEYVSKDELKLLGYEHVKIEERKSLLENYDLNNYQLANIESSSMILINETEIFDLNTNKTFLTSMPRLGLFRHMYFKGKLCKINSFFNYQDIIIGKELKQLFEPFFVFDVVGSKDSIIFRKVTEDDLGIIQATTVPNELIVLSEEISCAYGTPFICFENLNHIYKNYSGKEYYLKDIIKRISEEISSGDRCWTSKNVQQNIFNPFFQRTWKEEERMYGFSEDELKKILNEYFIFDVTLGFYYSMDTWIDRGDNAFAIDKKWFEIFYKNIKKYKIKEMNKLSTLVVGKLDEEYFRKFTLLEGEIQKYIDLVYLSDNFEHFFKLVISVVIADYE